MSCNNCQAITTTGSCGACGTAKYCSKKCQIEDWSTHKHLCAKIPTSMRSVKWSLGLKTEEMKFLFERFYPETAAIGLENFICSNFKGEEKVDSVLFFRLWKHALTEKFGRSTLIMNIKSPKADDPRSVIMPNDILTLKTDFPVKSEFFKLTLKNNYLKRKLEEANVTFGMHLMIHNNGYVFLSVIGPMVAPLDKIIELEAKHIDVRLKYKGIDVVDSFIDDLGLDHKWRLKPISL